MNLLMNYIQIRRWKFIQTSAILAWFLPSAIVIALISYLLDGAMGFLDENW